MPYIGKSPVGGGFHKLDNLTASATATYALTLGGAAYFPETANQLLVSLNGVIQAPQDSFTVSGSNLIFDSALTASDSIDFVVALGDVLGVGSVTDGAVTTAKIGNNAVTDAKLANTLDLSSKALTMPTGAVLQVLQSVNDTVEVFSTTETWLDITDMSVTITPTSASSKIMVEYTIHHSTSGGTIAHQLVRNSTAIGLGSANGTRLRATSRTAGNGVGNDDENHISTPTTMKYLDSPASTSAQTYKLQLRIQNAEGNITTNTSHNQPDVTFTYGSRVISTITVTEIAG